MVKFTGNCTAIAAWVFATHPGPGPIYNGVQVASFDARKASNQWTADSSIDTTNGGCAQVVDSSSTSAKILALTGNKILAAYNDNVMSA